MGKRTAATPGTSFRGPLYVVDDDFEIVATIGGDVTKTTDIPDTSAAALTDNSGGSAGSTIAAIGGTYDQGEVANAVASLAAQVNALITTVTKIQEKLA